MNVAILLNRDHPRLRVLGKRLLAAGYQLARGRLGALDGITLPEFDSFASLLDPSPVVLGTEEEPDWSALARCDVLLWEWGWTEVPPRRALEVRRRLGIPLVMFPGPLDRFWRELDPRDLPVHFEALRATDGIGVMLRDTEAFYRVLAPHAHVFHLPVPVDHERLRRLAGAPATRRRDLVFLTAPTRICGTPSQLPIATFLAFKRLLEWKPDLEGICFAYDEEERRETETVLRELQLGRRVRIHGYVRPIFRFIEILNSCRVGLSLPHALIQGRLALLAACLGIPMVTNDDPETHRTLFPRTSVRWHDVEGAARACIRLLEDEDHYQSVAEEAWRAVSYYSVERCRERLRDGIRGALARRDAAAGHEALARGVGG